MWLVVFIACLVVFTVAVTLLLLLLYVWKVLLLALLVMAALATFTRRRSLRGTLRR